MSPKDLSELLEKCLAGELDAAAEAEFEKELEADPDLVHELAGQRLMDQALGVLLGDGTADQKVTVSVLASLRGGGLDSFKQDLLAEIRKEEAKKKKADAALRHTTASIPKADPPEPARPKTVIVPPAPRRAGFRRAAGIAAALALAAGLWFLLPRGGGAAAAEDALVLSATGDARVQRGNTSFPAASDLRLQAGDRLLLSEGGAAKLGFAHEPTRLELRGPAQLHLVKGSGARRVDLLRGELVAEVGPQDEALVVVTPHAEARLSDGAARLESAADFTRAEVRRGAADLVRRSDRKSVRLAPRQYAVAGKDVELVAQALDPAAPAGNAPPAVATVRKVQGDVFLFTKSPSDRVPAVAGQPVRAEHGILTEGRRSLVILDYPDSTRLEVGPDAVIRRLMDEKEKTRKHVVLESGALTADVVKQPFGRPMTLATAQAEARVIGTRFQLSAEGEATRLQVEEGAVQFTQVRERESIVVRSGYRAVAAPGRPFEAVPVPGAAKYVEIDLGSGEISGDGEWAVDGRAVRQSRISRLADPSPQSPASSYLFKVAAEESVLLEATAEVDRVTPDGSPGFSAWGFGLVAGFRDEHLVLRTRQAGEGGSVFEFKDRAAIPFEHGREGTYRLKLRLERRPGQAAVLRGKIWQGDREPDGWMIESEQELEGPLSRVGFQTLRCSCTFSSFKVRVLKDEPR
jgi:ferric-dicitrate binding protein FerR (iron transport regulator)